MIHPMQNTAIISVAIIDIVLITLSQIALWQRKEYRWDRLYSYLDSPEGTMIKQVWALIAGLFVGIGWIMVLLGNELFAEYAGIASVLILLASHGIRIRNKGMMRPTLTARSGMILLGVALACMAYGTYIILPDILLALQLATLLFFLPAIIAIIVVASIIPTAIQKRRSIAQATTLRTSLHNLTVVGITGSVGKTSTKTYLLHILGGESKTICATMQHRNAPYVVALDILSRLTTNTTTYIAEMGAYKKGEITELAELTKPKIGVVTAITNQHVALFGSLENLASAKWELIEALPIDGIAVLNADDDRIVQRAKTLKKKIVWFSTQKQSDVYMQNNNLIIGNDTYEVELPVISRGQIISAIAAAAAAHALGVSSKQIAQQLTTLPVLPRTMEFKKGINGCRIIDDSYSASEASVINAIEYLQESSGKDKRLILVPIIELGKQGPVVHERIGKQLANLHAHVFIYGDAYKQDIQKGLGKSVQTTVMWYTDAKLLAQEATKNIAPETIILLEGRLPALICNAVL